MGNVELSIFFLSFFFAAYLEISVNHINFSISVLNTGLQRRTLGDNFDECLTPTHASFITTADNRFIFASGFWDKSFRLYFSETGRFLLQFPLITIANAIVY